jgi:hypothetical protein
MLHSFPILHKINESALVPAALNFDKYSKPIGLALSPLPNVGVASLVFPHARAVFEVVVPLAFVDLPVWPAILALSMHLPIFELPLIGAIIAVLLESLSTSEVVFPVSLIDLSAIIDHDADSLPFAVLVLAVVDCLFVLFEAQGGRAVECGEVDLVGEVGLEVMVQLLVCVAIAVGGGQDGHID